MRNPLCGFLLTIGHEVQPPAACDIGLPDIGHEVTFTDETDQTGFLKAAEGAKCRRHAAAAASGDLPNPERDVAIVLAVVLADQQQENGDVKRCQHGERWAVIDGVRQHNEPLATRLHRPPPWLSTSSQSMPASGG